MSCVLPKNTPSNRFLSLGNGILFRRDWKTALGKGSRQSPRQKRFSSDLGRLSSCGQKWETAVQSTLNLKVSVYKICAVAVTRAWGGWGVGPAAKWNKHVHPFAEVDRGRRGRRVMYIARVMCSICIMRIQPAEVGRG